MDYSQIITTTAQKLPRLSWTQFTVPACLAARVLAQPQELGNGSV
jgi:hypothetical protein